MENSCVVCGKIIPEGRQVCPNCDDPISRARKAALMRAIFELQQKLGV